MRQKERFLDNLATDQELKKELSDEELEAVNGGMSLSSNSSRTSSIEDWFIIQGMSSPIIY